MERKKERKQEGFYVLGAGAHSHIHDVFSRKHGGLFRGAVRDDSEERRFSVAERPSQQMGGPDTRSL